VARFLVSRPIKPEVEIWQTCCFSVEKQLKTSSNRKRKYGRFAHAQYIIRYITLIYGGMSEILTSHRKSGSRNMMVTSNFRPEVEIWPFRACAVKNSYKTLIYGGIAEIPPSYRKSGSRNTMVTSDFRPEVEIWPFCACAVKIRNITFVIGTLLSLCNCYEADITLHSICF